VEDQVEPDLELVREVVAGLRDVLGDRLGEVGILVGGELAEDALRRLCKLPGGEQDRDLGDRETRRSGRRRARAA